MNYRWLSLGDLNACFALMLDNMVNLAVFASILTGGFGFPADVVFLKMIPGTTLGVLVGNLIYTGLAVRLARRTGRHEVTAMPLGLDTPSTLGMALTVVGPAFLALKSDWLATGMAEAAASAEAAHAAWGIGMATMLFIGVAKVILSFAGDWVRRRVPQAGLLGSIGGIGLMLLAFLPLMEIFKAPVVGLTCLGLVVYSLLAGIELPYKIPGAAAAVLLGTGLYYGLGSLSVLGIEATMPPLNWALALPKPTLHGLAAMPSALPYLPIALPFGLLTVIGGINVTESARAAGDNYKTRDILLTEAICTLVAGIFGGVAQSTPFIGHPAYKQMGARAGYTLICGLVVGIGGMLGAVSFLVALLPLAAVMPILLFVGFEITVQAFHACAPKHAPAVAFSFLPIVANLLLIRQDTLLGGLHASIAASTADLGTHTEAMHTLVRDVATRFDAHIIVGLGHGFILTAMMWGSFFSLIIDRQLVRAAGFVLFTGIMTLFGAVHSTAAAGGLYWPWRAPSAMSLEWAMGYFFLAGLLAVLSYTPGARQAYRQAASDSPF